MARSRLVWFRFWLLLALLTALVACGGSAGAPAVERAGAPGSDAAPQGEQPLAEPTAAAARSNEVGNSAPSTGSDDGAAPEAPRETEKQEGAGAALAEPDVSTDATSSGGADMAEAPAGAPPADESAGRPQPTMVPAAPASAPDRSQQFDPVTAGVVDDNVQWQEYLAYRERNRYNLTVRDRDVSERYIIQLSDSAGQPVHDATVEVSAGQQPLFTGRTDAGGRLLFHPLALDSQSQIQASRFDVLATKGQVSQRGSFERGSAPIWPLTLPGAPIAAQTQLDLLFLIDATGSMGDEIDKLRATMGDIADSIAQLPERPAARYGLVAYRDRGDQFVVRTSDFTGDLGSFQRQLAGLQAGGGGDYPEALNEALNSSLNTLSWRGEETVRLIVLVADAPPQLNYGEPFSYDSDMFEAVRKGIKILPVAASGTDPQAEYVFRQLAQFTGGSFVFLTYAQAGAPSSGPGVETTTDVSSYSVDTLDRLVVRLVRDELARLPRAGQSNQSQPPTTSTSPSGTVAGSIIRLEGLPGISDLDNDGFTGAWSVDGIPMEVGSEGALTEVRGQEWPQRIDIPVGRPDVSRVAMLLSLGNGYAGFEGKTVGHIQFLTDAGPIEVPLVAGQNIRDWCVGRGRYQVVADLRDPTTREVWRGPLPGCDEAALSALIVEIPRGYLHMVTLIDESRSLLEDADPGIHLYGLSVN